MLDVFFPLWTDAKGTIREIVLPKGLDLDRPKRTRTSFTAEQLYRLELEFQRCQYVVGRERTELARQLNLSETQVRGSVLSRGEVLMFAWEWWLICHFKNQTITTNNKNSCADKHL